MVFSHPPVSVTPTFHLKSYPTTEATHCASMCTEQERWKLMNPVGSPCRSTSLSSSSGVDNMISWPSAVWVSKKENRTAFEPSMDSVLRRTQQCSNQHVVSTLVLHDCPWPFGACERVPDTASACFKPSSFTTLRSSFWFSTSFFMWRRRLDTNLDCFPHSSFAPRVPARSTSIIRIGLLLF